MLTYAISVASLMMIYVLMCISFDLLAGDLRLMSLATPSIAGVGAYMAAHAEVTFALPDLLGLLASVAVAMLVGLVVAIISLRVSGVYFLLVTMSVGVILYTVFGQWRSVTGGPSGFSGVTPIDIPGVSPSLGGLIVSLVLTAVVAILISMLRRSRIGRRWRALGEDRLAAMNLGIDPRRELLRAVLLSSAIAGAAGFLHARIIGVVDPSPFSLQIAILVLAITIAGGRGSITGCIAGAAIGIVIPEALRFIPFGNLGAHQSAVREAVFGILLVIVLGLRPHGLFGRRSAAQWRGPKADATGS
jgi:branched-chain amino acid transport system permease protein